jgi:hypothetical protein
VTLRAVSVLLVAVCAVLTLGASPAALAASEMTADAYAGAVSGARSALARATPRIAGESVARAAAGDVVRLVPERASVAVGAERIQVDGSVTHRLAGRLADATDAGARERAAAELDGHLASLESALGRRGAPPADDPAVLTEVLAGIGVRGQSELERTLSELMERLNAALEEFFASLLDTRAAGTGARVAFLVLSGVAALGILALVYTVVRRWLRSTAPRPRAVAGVALADGPVVEAAEGLPPDAARYAAEAAAEGRYRDAVRALFGGAARTLVARGVVAHARTRTNAELLADARAARPAIHAPLRALCGVFEPAWYGHGDPGPEGYDIARARFEEVLALADGRPEA